MADYYPLLVRAIAGLPQNTGETRRVVFDRARAALLKQLRGVEPPLPEGEIARERQSLEDAIHRIEADYVPAEQPPDSDQPAAEDPSPLPEPAAPDVTPAAPPPVGPAEASPPDAIAERDVAVPEAKAPEAAERDSIADHETPSHQKANEDLEDAADAATETPSDQRPTLGRGKAGGRGERPRVPGERDVRAPAWRRAVLPLLLLAVLVAGGAYAVMNREALFGEAGRESASAPAQPAAPEPAKTAEQPKSADRVAQADGSDVRRAPTATPRAAATTQRAFLFEEAAGGAQGLQTYEGSVSWKTETFAAGPGLPPDVGIRADIQVPGRLSATFTLRRNTDPALPASHTIEISFNLPQDFAYGGINNVPGIRMKQTESAQGAPLAGLSVRVSPTYFLVGLSAVPADRERNLMLLQARPWIDVPLVYTNNKRAIIAFEKGPQGEQVFRDAFAAWGELLPAEPPPMVPAPGGG